MDGVTILQTIEETHWAWGWSPIGAVLVVLGFLVFILGIMFDWRDIFCCCFLVMCLVLSGAFFSHAIKIPTTYQYQVLVDDSVNMNEFLTHYTIIEQQGITYIVEEVEEGN